MSSSIKNTFGTNSGINVHWSFGEISHTPVTPGVVPVPIDDLESMGVSWTFLAKDSNNESQPFDFRINFEELKFKPIIEYKTKDDEYTLTITAGPPITPEEEITASETPIVGQTTANVEIGPKGN